MLVPLGLMILVLGFYPAVFFYQYNLSSLSRVHRSIELGSSLSEVRAKLDAYCESRAGSPSLQCSVRESDRDLYMNVLAEPGTIAVVYDINVFGELQLSVLLDPDERVTDTLFIAD
jgi:hypothetical protein